MPTSAQVVIIGGGIVGCSIAYHLTEMGWKDVVVLEKGELTSGSTWHAAGLVGQLRSSRNITRMLTYSVELYRRLEAVTGQHTGWREVGGLRIAASADRMLELKKGATTARSFGLPMELLSPKEALDLFPLMSIDGIVGAAFLPTDGYVDPSSVTQALAKGARSRGARFVRGVRVQAIEVEGGMATAIQTDHGTIQAEVIVNAAGMWAREIGALAGVNVPLIPVQHQYMVTEQIPGQPPNLPTMRDPDNLVYYKEETGGLIMGGYEPNPLPWNIHGVPKDFGQQLLKADFDHFEQLLHLACKRTPILESVGIQKLINGPEAFTPDGHFIMGRAPELRNFFVAAGFNAHGIAAGGGAGRMLAEWIVAGQPSLDLWSVDIRRFGPHHRSTSYVSERTLELYGKHYTISWPHEEHHSARGVRKSPLYQTLKQQGAVYGAKFGWERPNWFAPAGMDAADTLSFGRANWFKPVGREHQAIREKVAIIDQSSFSKLEVRGPGALAALQQLAVNDIDKPVGSLVYTQLCNTRGGIECDLTVARLAEQHFYLVTGTAFGVHDLDWIQRHLPSDGSAIAYDTTSSRGVLNLCGPLSRRVLEQVTSDDVSHQAFGFGQCRQIRIGHAPALALRVSYVGELGWELHVPTEFMAYVYERLWEAGQACGIINAGYRAIESCRLEKGYRYWSSDLTPDYTPYEAGLGFCVRLKKGDFIGREALAQQKAKGPDRQLACFTLDQPVQLTGGETICRQGEVLGVLTSGGFGYTLGQTIAYGYLPTKEMAHTDFEVVVFGDSYSATRHDGVLYDPERKKILS
ncbi:MAG: FAD-dependent oxidoreductase [Candidatus Sericytochromatia bacterium]